MVEPVISDDIMQSLIQLPSACGHEDRQKYANLFSNLISYELPLESNLNNLFVSVSALNCLMAVFIKTFKVRKWNSPMWIPREKVKCKYA